jgi:small subunit ribosomal protein S8
VKKVTLNDPLANVLSQIKNYERIGKNQTQTKNNSKLIKQVLTIMQEKSMIGSYEITEDGKGGIVKINLNGNLNDCGVIKPRYRVKVQDLEKFEKRYLPAMGFGTIIISTNQGLMTHTEAKEKNIGGTLISYAY